MREKLRQICNERNIKLIELTAPLSYPIAYIKEWNTLIVADNVTEKQIETFVSHEFFDKAKAGETV